MLSFHPRKNGASRRRGGAGKEAALVRPLREWFAREARALPWREKADPYGIWISEIMLQQTQVKTVIPYWERWMARLPTVQSLADANVDDLLKLWEGLGYYRRVRNILKAARIIDEKHGGQFPRGFEEILELPGIGRYTAGAVASIAFNQPRPILDGNVIRVFARVFGIEDNVRTAPAREKLWGLAEEFIKGADRLMSRYPDICSHANQSLMELGATVCTPRRPQCARCPIRRLCRAYREGRIEALPNLGIRPPSIRREMIAFVVECGGRYLITRRPNGSVNGGLWEFPNVAQVEGGRSSKILDSTNLAFEPFVEISHTIMRHRIRLKVVRAKVRRKIKFKTQGVYRWADQGELAQLAFPSAHRSIVSALRAVATCEVC